MLKLFLYSLAGIALFVAMMPVEDALNALKDRAREDEDNHDLKLAQKAELIIGLVVSILFFAVVFLLER